MKRFWIFAASDFRRDRRQRGAAGRQRARPARPKAAVCQACHGANGNSANPEWPSLAGLGADYIAEQLQNFKDGKRNNPIMMPMAAALSAQDMADLGCLLRAACANTGLEADPGYLAGRREALSRRRQGSRHSGVHGLPRSRPAAATSRRNFPALRGQHSVYVVEAVE